MRDGDRHLFIGHQVFKRDLDTLVGNRRAALVAVFLLDLFEFLHDHVTQLLFRRQNALVLSDALANFGELVEDFVRREPRQPVELQIENGVRLTSAQLAS